MSEGRLIIVCSALRDQNGRVICGVRHFDVLMRLMIANSKDWVEPVEQGFIDQFGRFYNRSEAHKIATQAGQIVRRCGGDDRHLFSENLY